MTQLNKMESGFDLKKAMISAQSQRSEDIARQILLKAGIADEDLAKSITTASGLVAYDLQAPAKNLYPVQTPIRNRIPRVGGGTGTATNWRQVNAIYGSGYDSMGWVPEGQRSGNMSYSTSNKAASYVTIGEEDNVTFEAINAARGFEDVKATMALRLLQKMMLKEEMAILAGNNSLALGTPSAPTLSAGGSGATLPGAPTTYSVIVVALTLEGYRAANSAGGWAANGITQAQTITGADGLTYTINGGSSAASPNATQAITLGQVLSCSVTPVLGAVAYAWYVGTAGSETLQAVTVINSVTFSAPLTGGRQAATAITTDHSTNTLGFDGLLTTALKAGNNAYVKTLATGTIGTGTALTASGRGSCNEVDDMLQAMWDNFQVSPDALWMGSHTLRNLTAVCLSAGSGSLLQYFKDPNAGEYALTAGGSIEFYYNPFRVDPAGGNKIPIFIHPFLPSGMILAWAENLPIQYQNSEVPNVAEVKTRQDYYQVDWPVTTRRRSSGVYTEEVLAVYAPFAMGVINNIGG